MKKAEDYRIVFHGTEHFQYFQGHGVAFTEWTDCVTGVGDSNEEALEDCLERLALSGEWDVEDLELRARREGWPTDGERDYELGEEEFFFVSIDLR